MNARELLAQSQINRPEQTRLAEEAELLALRPVQFTPTANTADGVVGKTTNGGQLTVFNGAQNFDPTLSESYQLNLSPGRATLVANSKAEPTTEQSSIVNAIVATASPTAEDPGQRDQLWLNVNQDVTDGIRLAEAWVFVQQLGAWHLISGQSTAAPTTLLGAGPPSAFTFGSTDEGDDYNTPLTGQAFVNTRVGRTYYWTGAAWLAQGNKTFDLVASTYPDFRDIEPGDTFWFRNDNGCDIIGIARGDGIDVADYDVSNPSCSTSPPQNIGGCFNSWGWDGNKMACLGSI